MSQNLQTETHNTHTSTQDYLLTVVDGAPGLVPTCLRGLLRALSWLHCAILEAWLATYTLGLANVTRLPADVIGVGNLSMGGTGKTLAVLKLARELSAAGKRVAILSRGYKRTSRDEVAVVSTPQSIQLSAQEAGDEPSLMADALPGIPVLVGKNRRLTGRYAIETFGSEVLILDDSFQYWRLHKDREIVLIDALQPASRDYLLPRGFLRRPWPHLRRAQEVWITHAELADPAQVRQLAARIARYAPNATLRYTEHHPSALHSLQGDLTPLETLRGRKVLALSGLGNPRQFEMMLTELGAEVTPCRFPDHHPYTPQDIETIQQQSTGEMLIVTTAKDAIRLPDELPFTVWVVEVELAEAEGPG
ncbi:MAG: tetraacyldisaccharide 4'-kinase [Armatimonadota bacterium]